MPESLLFFILENTNKKVQNFQNRFADSADYFCKNEYCKLLDMVELEAFFGLPYLLALLESNFFLADLNMASRIFPTIFLPQLGA